MSEREPIQQSVENTEQVQEQLTLEERQDLSNLWEALGTGNPLDINADNEAIRSQMWADTQQALLENVLPNLKNFERNQELEKAVMNAPEQSEKRANAEFALVANYMKQLANVPDNGYSTTPKLSEKYEYGLNCVMKSALAATLFERTGMEVYTGELAGHVVALVRDAVGNTIYTDPNGITGKLKQLHITDKMSGLYHLQDTEQATLNVPYKEMIIRHNRESFSAFILHNVTEEVLTTHDESSKKLYTDYANILAAQSWEKIAQKLFPNELKISAGEEENIRESHEYSKQRKLLEQRIEEGMFGGEEVDRDTYNRLITTTIQEIRENGLVEQISTFLTDSEQEKLPKNISASTTKLLRLLNKELEQIKTEHPEARNRLIANFVKILHT